jgi:hypothetical protein
MKLKHLFVVLAACMMLVSCSLRNPASGDKIGYIIKVSQSGIFCTTWEATLVRGGLNDGSGAFAQPFDFTIEDPRLVQIAQQAMNERREVKLTYTTEGVASACRSDSGGDFAKHIEFLSNEKKVN